MDIQKIKLHIYNEQKIEYVLNDIGCKFIKNKGSYFQCGNYNGDNKTAIVVYNDEKLTCENYTRDIKGKKDTSDLIDLVMYNKSISLFHACKYLCDILNLKYYDLENDDDIPESLKITQMLLDMKNGEFVDEVSKLHPINEDILNYYRPYCNEMFKADNIDYSIQKIFEIGYDDDTNRITIPIRDEIGNLVGVKGRYFGEECENKYIYLERCAKSKILYGLDKAYNFIKKAGFVYVVESEKAVMQMWNMGIFNVVSTGGKKISKQQRIKLYSLCVDIIFVFDKDVLLSEICAIAETFPRGINISAIIDSNNVLNEKESPTDNKDKWGLLKNNITSIREV